MRLAYADNKEAINQSPWGLFCLFTYLETQLFPVVLGNLIVWQARPPPHAKVTRSFSSVESDLSYLAFSKSMHTHTHTHNTNNAPHAWKKNTITHRPWVRRRVRPLHSDNTWIQTAGLMRSDVASGVWNTLRSQWTRSTTCSVYSTEVRQTIQPQRTRPYLRWILKKAFVLHCSCNVLWSCVH